MRLDGQLGEIIRFQSLSLCAVSPATPDTNDPGGHMEMFTLR